MTANVSTTTSTASPEPRRRRWVRVDEGFAYVGVAKSKGWQLIKDRKIRAKKMDGVTLLDLDSVDEYHASLPDR